MDSTIRNPYLLYCSVLLQVVLVIGAPSLQLQQLDEIIYPEYDESQLVNYAGNEETNSLDDRTESFESHPRYYSEDEGKSWSDWIFGQSKYKDDYLWKKKMKKYPNDDTEIYGNFYVNTNAFDKIKEKKKFSFWDMIPSFHDDKDRYYYVADKHHYKYKPTVPNFEDDDVFVPVDGVDGIYVSSSEYKVPYHEKIKKTLSDISGYFPYYERDGTLVKPDGSRILPNGMYVSPEGESKPLMDKLFKPMNDFLDMFVTPVSVDEKPSYSILDSLSNPFVDKEGTETVLGAFGKPISAIPSFSSLLGLEDKVIPHFESDGTFVFADGSRLSPDGTYYSRDGSIYNIFHTISKPIKDMFSYLSLPASDDKDYPESETVIGTMGKPVMPLPSLQSIFDSYEGPSLPFINEEGTLVKPDGSTLEPDGTYTDRLGNSHNIFNPLAKPLANVFNNLPTIENPLNKPLANAINTLPSIQNPFNKPLEKPLNNPLKEALNNLQAVQKPLMSNTPGIFQPGLNSLQDISSNLNELHDQKQDWFNSLPSPGSLVPDKMPDWLQLENLDKTKLLNRFIHGESAPKPSKSVVLAVTDWKEVVTDGIESMRVKAQNTVENTQQNLEQVGDYVESLFQPILSLPNALKDVINDKPMIPLASIDLPSVDSDPLGIIKPEDSSIKPTSSIFGEALQQAYEDSKLKLGNTISDINKLTNNA